MEREGQEPRGEGGEGAAPETAPRPPPRRRRSWALRVGAAGAGLAAIGLVAVLSALAAVLHASTVDEARPVDAIVVLGAAQYWGRPSPVFERRLLHAHELYEKGYGRVIVTTGSKREGDRVTEGYAGFNYLRRLGVPEEDILLVVHGSDTWEELTATAHVLGQRGMRRVLLVSDPYHSHRAKRSAVEAGLEAYVSPTAAPSSPSQLGREAVAVALGRLIGFRRVSQLR